MDKASIILEQIDRQEIDCPGFGEVTALHMAVMKVRIIFASDKLLTLCQGNLPMVSLLTSAGASLTSCDLVHFTPVHWAAWWGRDQILQHFLVSFISTYN